MRSSANPWVDRFDLRASGEVLAARLKVPGCMPPDLRKRSVPEAAEALRRSLRSVFVASAQTLDIIGRLVSVMSEHASAHYPDRNAYLRGLHAPHSPFEAAESICFTGLAGVGKSSLVAALGRLLSHQPVVEVGDGCGSVGLQSIWHVPVKAGRSLNDLLPKLDASMAEELAGIRCSARLIDWLGRYAFKRGVGMLFVDELQFLTQSAAANSLVTKRLHELRYIGLPMCFSCNFSLCHRLVRRPQEDRHRLLSRPLVMVPELPNDPSEFELCREYRRASDGALFSKGDVQIEQVHEYTAGLRRLQIFLLTLAYRVMRERHAHEVTGSDLEVAFRSMDYTQARLDVKLLRQQAATGRKERDDLWSPFDLPCSVTAAVAERAAAAARKRVQEQAVLSSLTAQEREHAKGVTSAVAGSDADRGTRSVGIKRRLPKATYESLRSGEQKLIEDGLTPPPLRPSRRVQQFD